VKPAGRRRKGSAGEREVAALLDGATIRGRTLTARRVPNVGAMAGGGWGGDVLVGERCCWCCAEPEPRGCGECRQTGAEPGSEVRFECKRRAGGQGFALLERWLEGNRAVVMRADRGEWLITMRLADYIESDI
jgi:hypothetical protein